ncbi:hypothetical protein ABZY58_11375 [Micromonospora tulbaghiae]|uniref:hypothetical protein n=1 Tax=Micromonospora tulbaghiae TaxID=479978 RepID=UPI0033AAA54A
MARMKVFSLGVHGFIGNDVRDALGAPSHIRQARVLAVAPTKAAAVHVYAEHGFRGVRPSDSEFRVAMGNDVDALAEAGLLNEPGVWVLPSAIGGGDTVVRMQPGGAPQRAGRLDRDGRNRAVFVPEEQP